MGTKNAASRAAATLSRCNCSPRLERTPRSAASYGGGPPPSTDKRTASGPADRPDQRGCRLAAQTRRPRPSARAVDLGAPTPDAGGCYRVMITSTQILLPETSCPQTSSMLPNGVGENMIVTQTRVSVAKDSSRPGAVNLSRAAFGSCVQKSPPVALSTKSRKHTQSRREFAAFLNHLVLIRPPRNDPPSQNPGVREAGDTSEG